MRIVALFLSTCLVEGSAEELADQLQRMSLDKVSAADAAGSFASIRHGSFLYGSEFRKILPLKRLLLKRPDLFLRLDTSDPVEELAHDLGLSREDAVENFLAHNYCQVDTALEKILKSTNDLVIAAVVIDPYGTLNSALLLPVTQVLIEYRRVKAGRCLQDLLPDVFQNPAVYNRYFTPLPGYRIIPNGEQGYTGIIPDTPVHVSDGHPPSFFTSSGDNPIISLYFALRESYAVLVDPRCGCAVRLSAPFKFAEFAEVKKWLVLLDDTTNMFHVWRSDSQEALIVPCAGYVRFNMLRDMRSVAFRHRLVTFILPTDLNVPFELTRMDGFLEDRLVKDTMSRTALTGFDSYGTGISLTDRMYVKVCEFTERLAVSMSEAAGMSMRDLERLVDIDGHQIGLVFLLINALNSGLCVDAWPIAMELTSRFSLRTREELIAFVVAVVNGFRPEGIEVVPPMRFFLKGEGRHSGQDVQSVVIWGSILRFIQSALLAPLADRRVRAVLICLAISISMSLIRYEHGLRSDMFVPANV